MTVSSPLFTFFFLLFFLFFSSTTSSYNILDFGAKEGGKEDCVEAITEAWRMACNSSSPSNIYVPHGLFLISKVKLYGPCRNKKMKFKINGTLMAPLGYTESSEWIAFDSVEGILISGGVLDGRGSSLWDCKLTSAKQCPRGATSLTFTNSRNIRIKRLTSIDSELFHIVIIRCCNMNLYGLNLIAPKWSPNTDGIHVQMSTKVRIKKTRIETGDDCISVGPKTSSLWVESVVCGPGHGISIGSLGKAEGLKEEGVQNVTVQKIVFWGSDNGLRIKTWGSNIRGYVKGVIFKHVVMNNVRNPIIIDQNYCPHNQNCPRKDSRIQISDVKYRNIKGTSASPIAINFDCSPTNPCKELGMSNIKLTYKNQPAKSLCRHASGNCTGLMIPPSCL
ncbi:polygalacturonase-like [Phalaenopsis equestris]|uniref:polygalacturonase-like n=1 Tax=Phalaenopsis equestris TaxID=78828 RepID=UPI0009E601D9|nr:polygalacturonase-like [Phalaenopsis equestris]